MADFLRKNRTNVSVIVVSFLTVILSVKLVRRFSVTFFIHSARRGAKQMPLA